MRGLLLRLSSVDPDAGASLRIIEYFDRLVEHGASLEAITRASAALGCCTAGLKEVTSGRILRFDGSGQMAPAAIDPVVIEAPVLVDDVTVGEVWLERDSLDPRDEMLIERMAVTAAARWRPLRGSEGADPALIELIIGTATEDQDRARALRLLGMNPTKRVRAVAVRACSGDVATFTHRAVKSLTEMGCTARGTQVGMTGVLLVQARIDVASALRNLPWHTTSKVSIGLGKDLPGTQCADSWNTAKVAAQFASAWRQQGDVLDYDRLGSLALLAQLSPERALENCDVQAIASLARTDTGEQDIEVLLAVTWHGSARQAASELHMHHSSVTNRLKHVEVALGLSMDEPVGRLRAHVAAITYRLVR